ncbi:MAG: LysR family transcriptional regulator substrate-binding protein [Evtepia gabavorous]
MPADSPSAAGPGPKEPPAGAGGRRYPRPGRGHRLLATFPSISRFWLPEILRDFAQHYPGITVSIRESGQEELDEWLREGSVDLAFCSYHENSQNHWIPFLEDEIWAVVPNGHPLAGCEELSLAQLASEPFILEDRAYDYDISRVIQEAGVHPNVRWTSKDELAILAMVRLELGVSVMPALYLHEDHPGVTVRPLVPRAHRQLGASLPDLDSLSPAARRFLVRAKKTMGVTR